MGTLAFRQILCRKNSIPIDGLREKIVYNMADDMRWQVDSEEMDTLLWNPTGAFCIHLGFKQARSAWIVRTIAHLVNEMPLISTVM